MEKSDSNLASDEARVKVTRMRVKPAARAALVNALASSYMAGDVNTLTDGRADFSIDALRRLTSAMGRPLTDHQLKRVKSDLIMLLDRKGARQVTLSDVENWSGSVKSRIAAQICPHFISSAVYPSYLAVASQVDRCGHTLKRAQIREVKRAVETHLEDIGMLKGGQEVRVRVRRLYFAGMNKMLKELRPHFVGGRGYISIQEVEERLQKLGHNLTKANIKELRNLLTESLQLKVHKDYRDDGLRTEFDTIATKLAQHFVLNEKYRPRRTDIVRLCKDMMGIEIPYWRTNLILTLMFETAPALSQRRKRNVAEVGPELLISAAEKQRVKMRLSAEVKEFHTALAGSIGVPTNPPAKIVEHAALILAYGIYSGKIDLAGLLPGARKMSPIEMETAVRMLRRLNFADT